MDELTRFARRLVEQLSASKEGVHRAVTIGQVREKILPYRTHRRALMLESVEDYETVLLRLIAGERGFVRTLPAAAARRCQEELAGANPDLGVLDEVADSTIQITSLAAAQTVGHEGEEVAPGEAEKVVALSEAKGPISKERPAPAVAPLSFASAQDKPQGDNRSEPPVIASEAKQSRRTAEIASAPVEPVAPRDDGKCPHCQHAMPSGRQVVFCPWCGGRLIPFTCPRCQTELDSEWRHCITCGASVKDPYRFT
jgi:double zinc ribbon protein